MLLRGKKKPRRYKTRWIYFDRLFELASRLEIGVAFCQSGKGDLHVRKGEAPAR